MATQPDQVQPDCLCALLDVTRRIPGYEAGSDGETDDVLSDLVLQESQDFIETTGREFIAKNTDTARLFDLTASAIARRQLPIGDVAAVSLVELLDYDDTTVLQTIDASQYVLGPRTRATWEPYRRIYFPYRPSTTVLSLAPGRAIRITGTFGFQAIPDTVRRAVATLVLVRYVNDVAAAGTALADAVNRDEFNLANALRSALDVRERFGSAGFA